MNAKVTMGVLVAALVVNLAAGWFYGFDKPMESDAMLFLQIAQSVADGDGYRHREGFWADEPTMSRAPGWPLVIAGALRAGSRGWGAEREDCRLQTADCRLGEGGRRTEDYRQNTQIPKHPSTQITTEQLNNLTTSPNAAIMRIVCLLLNALNAVLVFMLTWTLTRNNRMALIAGAIYLFYPTALYHAVTGLSEIMFITLVLGGVVLNIRFQVCIDTSPCLAFDSTQGFHRNSSLAATIPMVSASGFRFQVSNVFGALLLGLAAIVRLNFVILPVVALLLYVLRKSYRFHVAGSKLQENIGDRVASKGKTTDRRLKTEDCRITSQYYAGTRRMGFGVILAAVLFILPISLWAVRNYKVSGEFPVLSTLRGQTFYGGNNEVVSSYGQYWGYWIFPDHIPGEPSMQELSATMSELEVDRYYGEKGNEYLLKNWTRVPGMLAGKLIRAYVPVPWRFTKGLIVINAYRFIMYLLILWGCWKAWKTMPVAYRVLALGFLAVNTFTVLSFWGCARFTFAVEPLFMPLAGLAWGSRDRRSEVSRQGDCLTPVPPGTRVPETTEERKYKGEGDTSFPTLTEVGKIRSPLSCGEVRELEDACQPADHTQNLAVWQAGLRQ